MKNLYHCSVVNQYIKGMISSGKVTMYDIYKHSGIDKNSLKLIDYYFDQERFIKLLRLADECGYLSENELKNNKPGVSNHSSHEHIANIHEMIIYNSRDFSDFIENIKNTNTIYPAHNFDISSNSSSIKLTHNFTNKDESFTSPQNGFHLILNAAYNIFNIERKSVSIYFNKHGIKDPDGFSDITGNDFEIGDGLKSSIQFDIKNISTENKNFNPHLETMLKRNLLDYRASESRYTSTLIKDNMRNFLLEHQEMPNLKYIANMMGMSKSTLTRRLESENTSYNELKDNIRMNQAKKMLLGTSDSIYEISEVSGFNSVSSFNRAFKLSSGLSPTEFRKKTFK
ncbi:AraC family transcriptional regulator [Vibrio splendidus]|uniref:helix-turn-helix domain-containing protein n=1 Tax=Vibrio splendidus TaxID=29497 RepID=UPI002236134E|nr:helix-turn-helix domain-containing protein [Vibrio splendidus]MCW4446528.1 AraC family transcriptional regulator [Vibrio splendidus]